MIDFIKVLKTDRIILIYLCAIAYFYDYIIIPGRSYFNITK